MADFLLSVGVDVGLSYDQMQKDISNLVSQLNSNPPKIKVELDIGNTTIDNLRTQIEELNNLARSANNSATSGGGSRRSSARGSGRTPGSETLSASAQDTTAYYNALRQVDTLLTQVTANHAKWTAASRGQSSEAYRNLGTYRDELISLKSQLQSGGMTVAEFRRRIAELRSNVTSSSEAIKSAGENTRTWGERLGALSAKFGTWFSITRVIMAAYRAVRQMVSNVIELDTAMTELRKVTDETDEVYDRFLVRATSRAKELGAALSDTVSATADFARLGYGIEDAEKLSDAAIVYKNVGDGISDIETASESIIATMQAFGVSAEDVMSIVDRFNEVGNNYAISSKGVGDALLRSAAAMHAANNSLDETIALATAANTVVQDPDKVGTTLKTVSMYLRAAKTDAEDAGESTDGMANSISELREELWKLTGKQVDIQLNDDTFKSTYQILKELSEVWDELSDVSQANILELVGGKRNSNVVSALLENFSVAEKALATSADSAGSALVENEKVLDSIQGKLNIMKATFETLSQNLIDSDIIKFVVDMGTGLMEFINGVLKVIDVLGGLKTILLLVSSLSASWLTNTVMRLATVLFTKFPSILSIISALKTGIIGLGENIRYAGLAWQYYAAGQMTASSVMQASIPVIGLVLAAITLVVAGVSLYNQKLEENRQKSIEAGKEAAKLTKDLDGLVEQYRKLGEDGGLSNSDRDKAYDIQKQINELLGEEVEKINLANGKYEDQIELLKKLQAEKAREKNPEIVDAKISAEDSLKDTIDTNLVLHTQSTDNGYGLVKNVLENLGLEDYIQEKTETSQGATTVTARYFNIEKPKSAEEALKIYGDMVEIKRELIDTYEVELHKGGELHDFYQDFKDKFDEVEAAVKKYKEAMSDYYTNQAVIKFNNSKFGGVLGAEIKNEKDMTKWIESMIDSKKVLDGEQAALIALAQTWYPQYTEQINAAIEAQANKVINNALLDKSLSGNIESLKNEASALGITEGKMIGFVLATIRANKQKLDVTQKVAALKEVAVWAGVAEKKMDAIFNAKDTEGWAERNGVTVNEHSDIDGTHTYTYKGIEYRNKGGVQEVLLDEAIQKEIGKFGDVKIPKTDYTPSNSGSSKKNEALDNYLKDAENRYKIHQDETKYIEELNYALNNLVKTEDERLDIIGKIDEAYRDLADNRIKDIEHQIDLTKELKGESADVTAQLSEIQRVANEEANRLRAMGYDDNSDEIQDLQKTWWDAENEKIEWRFENSKNWIDQRNTFGDWHLFKDSEVEAWERVVKWLKEEYPHAIDEIKEAEENLFEARKKEVTDLLDLKNSKIDSFKTLLQSYYDVRNAVSDAQHEINKEFAASLTMSEYLDERTKDLLFNQKDYNVLSDKLVDIQAEAEKLQRRYNQDVLSATADNLDEITSKYQMQYETLMKTYEIAKAELEVAKKRQQLDNVLNERNVSMFINGQWQWVANTQDVIDAQNELADAEYEAEKAKTQKEQTDSMNELTAASDRLTTIINKIDSGVINLNNGVGEITSALNSVVTENVPALKNVINETKTALRNFTSNLSSAKSNNNSNDNYSSGGSSNSSSKPKTNATATIPGLGTVGVHIDSSGKTTTSGLPSGTVVHTSGGDYKITGGSGGSYTSVKVKNKYAGGTGNTKAGDTLIGEKEPEVYIDNDGHFIPVEYPTVFADIEAGGKVFNGTQLKKLEMLWDLSNTKLSGKPSVSSTDNSIHIGGITISEQGNEDWINGLRRYVYTHKGSM